MANLRDFTGKNRVFTGTKGIKIPSGTQAERVNDTAVLRYNSDNSLFEYYTGTDWKAIDSPPIVNTINVAGAGDVTTVVVDSTTGGNASIVIKGSLFSTTGTVTVVLEASSGSNISPSTTTVNNANQITIVVPYSSFVNANEPYTVKVTNPSGLSASLADCISVDTDVVFTTAAGSLGGIYDTFRSSYTLSSAGATDADGDTITYSITSGALPSGLSFNTSTAAITGTASAVGSDTTSTFTVQAVTADLTISREFSITVYAPITTTFSNTGSDQSFTAPVGVNAVTIKTWGAGGGGAFQQSWGGANAGGAGGYASGTVTVTGGSDYKVVVGSPGAAGDGSANYGGGGQGSGWGNGGGGGLSGFFTGSGAVFSTADPESGAHGRSILIAGGGGGGGANRGGNCAGGAGGGTNGQDGNSPNGSYNGHGASQNSGGSGGSGSSGGGALRGANNNSSHGAGGGGGYYGGGAGGYNEPNDMGGGGGGSGYYNSSLVNSPTLTGGSNTTPGNSGDGDRGSAGNAGNSASSGTGGVLKISY